MENVIKWKSVGKNKLLIWILNKYIGCLDILIIYAVLLKKRFVIKLNSQWAFLIMDFEKKNLYCGNWCENSIQFYPFKKFCIKPYILRTMNSTKFSHSNGDFPKHAFTFKFEFKSIYFINDWFDSWSTISCSWMKSFMFKTWKQPNKLSVSLILINFLNTFVKMCLFSMVSLA